MPNIKLKDVPFAQKVKIIILVNEKAEIEQQEDSHWSLLAGEQFLADDYPADATYKAI